MAVNPAGRVYPEFVDEHNAPLPIFVALTLTYQYVPDNTEESKNDGVFREADLSLRIAQYMIERMETTVEEDKKERGLPFDIRAIRALAVSVAIFRDYWFSNRTWEQMVADNWNPFGCIDQKLGLFETNWFIPYPLSSEDDKKKFIEQASSKEEFTKKMSSATDAMYRETILAINFDKVDKAQLNKAWVAAFKSLNASLGDLDNTALKTLLFGEKHFGTRLRNCAPTVELQMELILLLFQHGDQYKKTSIVLLNGDEGRYRLFNRDNFNFKRIPALRRVLARNVDNQVTWVELNKRWNQEYRVEDNARLIQQALEEKKAKEDAEKKAAEGSDEDEDEDEDDDDEEEEEDDDEEEEGPPKEEPEVPIKQEAEVKYAIVEQKQESQTAQALQELCRTLGLARTKKPYDFGATRILKLGDYAAQVDQNFALERRIGGVDVRSITSENWALVLHYFKFMLMEWSGRIVKYFMCDPAEQPELEEKDIRNALDEIKDPLELEQLFINPWRASGWLHLCGNSLILQPREYDLVAFGGYQFGQEVDRMIIDLLDYLIKTDFDPEADAWAREVRHRVPVLCMMKNVFGEFHPFKPMRGEAYKSFQESVVRPKDSTVPWSAGLTALNEDTPSLLNRIWAPADDGALATPPDGWKFLATEMLQFVRVVLHPQGENLQDVDLFTLAAPVEVGMQRDVLRPCFTVLKQCLLDRLSASAMLKTKFTERVRIPDPQTGIPANPQIHETTDADGFVTRAILLPEGSMIYVFPYPDGSKSYAIPDPKGDALRVRSAPEGSSTLVINAPEGSVHRVMGLAKAFAEYRFKKVYDEKQVEQVTLQDCINTLFVNDEVKKDMDLLSKFFSAVEYFQKNPNHAPPFVRIPQLEKLESPVRWDSSGDDMENVIDDGKVWLDVMKELHVEDKQKFIDKAAAMLQPVMEEKIIQPLRASLKNMDVYRQDVFKTKQQSKWSQWTKYLRNLETLTTFYTGLQNRLGNTSNEEGIQTILTAMMIPPNEPKENDEAKEKADREAREAKERVDREAREKEAREAQERADREAKEAREAKERADQEAREREARENKERLDREVREARERADQIATNARQKEHQEAQEAKERADREAQQRVDRENKERLDREVREARERADQIATNARQKEHQEAQEAKEKEEREARAKASANRARERSIQEAKEKADQENRERAAQEAKERSGREIKEPPIIPPEPIVPVLPAPIIPIVLPPVVLPVLPVIRPLTEIFFPFRLPLESDRRDTTKLWYPESNWKQFAIHLDTLIYSRMHTSDWLLTLSTPDRLEREQLKEHLYRELFRQTRLARSNGSPVTFIFLPEGMAKHIQTECLKLENEVTMYHALQTYVLARTRTILADEFKKPSAFLQYDITAHGNGISPETTLEVLYLLQLQFVPSKTRQKMITSEVHRAERFVQRSNQSERKHLFQRILRQWGLESNGSGSITFTFKAHSPTYSGLETTRKCNVSAWDTLVRDTQGHKMQQVFLLLFNLALYNEPELYNQFLAFLMSKESGLAWSGWCNKHPWLATMVKECTMYVKL